MACSAVPIPDPAPLLAALRSYVAHIIARSCRRSRLNAGNDQLIPQYRRLLRAVRQTDFETPADLLAVLAPFVSSRVTRRQSRRSCKRYGRAARRRPRRSKHDGSRLASTMRSLTSRLCGERDTRRSESRSAGRSACTIDCDRREAGSIFRICSWPRRGYCAKARHPDSIFVSVSHICLIDEFQDTDPIQAEVMLLLTADDPSETDWRRCRPVSGSLFVVGDPKQSIYRFRRADIVTYNEVKRIIAVDAVEKSFR